MKRKSLIIILSCAFVLFIVGLLLVFNSGNIADSRIHHAALTNNWITGDVEKYQDTIITNCQIGGAVLSLIGGIGFHLCLAAFIMKPTNHNTIH